MSRTQYKMQYSAWVLENAVLLTLTRLQQSGRFWQQNNTHTNVTVKTGTAGTGEPQMSHDGMVWRKHHFVFCVNVQNLLYTNPAPGNDFLFYFKVATWLSLLGTLSCTSCCFFVLFRVYSLQKTRVPDCHAPDATIYLQTPAMYWGSPIQLKTHHITQITGSNPFHFQKVNSWPHQ